MTPTSCHWQRSSPSGRPKGIPTSHQNVDYSNVPTGRDFDKGAALQVANRAGGLNGNTATAATKIIDTQRSGDPFIEQ